MDVLEALGGWRNINQEKLDQIKVDNPPLYNAITKAINLLAKKYGGEDIVIEKPIEVVEEKASTIESEVESDYAFLKRMEILTLTKGDWVTRNDIVRTTMQKIKLEDLVVRGLVSRVSRRGDNEYKISNAGQALIDKYELQNKQVKESYDLEGFDGFAAYLRNVKKLTEKKGDWITIEEYTKEYLPLVPSMTFDQSLKANEQILKFLSDNGLVLVAEDEYLVSDKGEALLAKNPEIFVEALPTTPTPPPSQATTQLSEEDRYMNIIKTILIGKIKFGRNPDSNESYKEFRLTNVVPITYDFISNFLPDLSKLYVDGLIEINSGILEVTLKGKTMLQNYLESKGKFGDFISEIEVLTAQSKTNQPTPTPTQPTPTQTNLRPSPTKSATLFSTGTKMFGNDGNVWSVTENKNGVKRWVKTNVKPTPAPVETPISEIDEDEVDLDILEQQLNDDSLEFDITDEDLENLEF